MNERFEKQAQDLEELTAKVKRLETNLARGNTLLVEADNQLREQLRTLAENVRNAHTRVYNKVSLAEKVQNAHIDRLSQAFAKGRAFT
jgi:septal ring factor EnvC (AmiA/AmiB activator)